MTNNNNPIKNGSSAKAAGRLSMISVLAISAGLAAAPAQAQSVIAPSDMPPSNNMMQSPVAVPQSAPAPAPTVQSAPVISSPAPTTTAPAAQPTTPDRADALAEKGGFDATTVAPEALAQIESEQQARKAAAAAAAAKAAAAQAAARTSVSARTPADSGADAIVAPATPPTTSVASAPVAGFDSAPPVVQSAPAAIEPAAAPADPAGNTDWTLLAALAGLLGIGGAGAYAVSRRRKSKAEPAGAFYRIPPVSPAVTAATMPELRSDPAATAPEQSAPEAQPHRVEAKAHLTDFVAGLPSYEAPRSRADRNVTIGQRRVAAAPRPYLAEADLDRRNGYFTEHLNAIPTPQNPFLTRQKRIKRARYLDDRLAEMKAARALNPAQVSVKMHATRPLEPAYS